MQHTPDTQQVVTTPAEPTVQPQGPQAIDPADFKFIGGGAPRNGWDSAARALPGTDQAPRNGW